MEKRFRAGDLLFGAFYPLGYIIAVFDVPGQAERALDSLLERGIGRDSAKLWTGEEALAYHTQLKKSRSVISQLKSKFPPSRVEHATVERYLSYAEEGREFVTVYVADKDQVESIGDLLAEAGAHSMRYYGRWATRDLGVQRSPNAPARVVSDGEERA
jgi:hypothetical protein